MDSREAGGVISYGFAWTCAAGIVPRVKRLLFSVLALLFMYKSLSEASFDPQWSLIYALIAIDYLLSTIND